MDQKKLLRPVVFSGAEIKLANSQFARPAGHSAASLTILSAQANSLGDVILDGVRGEIRDGIGDSVRRDVCRQREERRNDEWRNDEQQNSEEPS